MQSETSEAETRLAETEEVPFYRKVDLPLFLAGMIAGVLALSTDAWWTLQGEGSNQIIQFQASPFYLQTLATGLPPTTPATIALGLLTRVVVGFAAVLLVVSSVKKSVWWKNIAQWFNISAVLEMFVSLAILVNTARQEALAAYGVSLPVAGSMRLPFSVLGLNLEYYSTPTVTAGFSFVFYAGILCVALVTFERLQSLKMIPAFGQMQLGTFRELTLAPPYAQVWAATDDKSLNPLSDDPSSVTDEKLASSLTNMYQTVAPGGTVTILFPTWSAWIAEKIQNLVKWVGFQADSREVVDPDGQPEVELKLLKPAAASTGSDTMTASAVTVPAGLPSSATTSETGPTEEPQLPSAQVPAQPVPMPMLKRIPARIPIPRRKSLFPRPEFEEQVWPKPKQSKKETAMVKSALKVISTYGVPVAYRELLNEVYLDLLQSHTEFESARAIEKVLLSHVGHELTLLEEESSPGRLVRKWWSGSEPPAVSSAQLEAIERLRAVSQMAESKIRGLKKRFRHESEGYHQGRSSDDDDSGGRT